MCLQKELKLLKWFYQNLCKIYWKSHCWHHTVMDDTEQCSECRQCNQKQKKKKVWNNNGGNQLKPHLFGSILIKKRRYFYYLIYLLPVLFGLQLSSATILAGKYITLQNRQYTLYVILLFFSYFNKINNSSRHKWQASLLWFQTIPAV